MNYKKEKTISIPDQNVEIDVRSKTTAERASLNRIPTGDKEQVQGQKRMLAEKKRKATWYQSYVPVEYHWHGVKDGC